MRGVVKLQGILKQDCGQRYGETARSALTKSLEFGFSEAEMHKNRLRGSHRKSTSCLRSCLNSMLRCIKYLVHYFIGLVMESHSLCLRVVRHSDTVRHRKAGALSSSCLYLHGKMPLGAGRTFRLRYTAPLK
jgi:hypothetical protein